MAGTIPAAGTVDVYSFTATAGQSITLKVNGNNTGLKMQLRGPGGLIVLLGGVQVGERLQRLRRRLHAPGHRNVCVQRVRRFRHRRVRPRHLQPAGHGSAHGAAADRDEVPGHDRGRDANESRVNGSATHDPPAGRRRQHQQGGGARSLPVERDEGPAALVQLRQHREQPESDLEHPRPQRPRRSRRAVRPPRSRHSSRPLWSR